MTETNPPEYSEAVNTHTRYNKEYLFTRDSILKAVLGVSMNILL